MLASVLDDHKTHEMRPAWRLTVLMWREKRFPVQGHQNYAIFLRTRFLILANIIQLVLPVGLVDSLCLIYLLSPAISWGRRLSFCSVTVQWFSAMRSWSRESSARCSVTQMSEITVSTCSPLNPESRFVHLIACFCLLGQKKGSECSHGTCCGWPLILHKDFSFPFALTQSSSSRQSRVFQLTSGVLWAGRGCVRDHEWEEICPINSYSRSIQSFCSASSWHYNLPFLPVSE